MGILKGLFRTRDAPTNRTAGSAYSFFMGGSTSGKRVNERSAMQMTAVYSCVVFCKCKFLKFADKNGEFCISVLEKVAGCPAGLPDAS